MNGSAAKRRQNEVSDVHHRMLRVVCCISMKYLLLCLTYMERAGTINKMGPARSMWIMTEIRRKFVVLTKNSILLSPDITKNQI